MTYCLFIDVFHLALSSPYIRVQIKRFLAKELPLNEVNNETLAIKPLQLSRSSFIGHDYFKNPV
jgi:hypothetical protein